MFIDKLITTFDTGLRTVFAPANASRQRPDMQIEESPLTETQKKQAAALMRINHVGEVCAQALYSGQALTSRNPQIVQNLQHAANEETDHLAWCESRLTELHSHTSYLNPIWYMGSLLLGIAAGIAGDKWSLGFLAETERQVTTHLENHLQTLPENDRKSI